MFLEGPNTPARTSMPPDPVSGYEWDLQFHNPGLGKFIIYQAPGGVLHVAGKEASSYRNELNAEIGEQTSDVINDMLRISASDRFQDEVGLHKTIPHTGKVLGGGVVLLRNGTVYMVGASKQFGSASAELLQQCAAACGVTLITGDGL